jgi:hypothetical protein
LGNNAINLLTLDTVELGYRTRFNQQTDMSIEVFGTYARDFRDLYIHAFDTTRSAFIMQFDNLDTKAYQLGATASLGFSISRVHARVFVTVQQTMIKDHDPNLWHFWDIVNNSAGYNPLDPHNQNRTGDHAGTPDLYGGFYLNYQPAGKWNINVNAYYFSRHTQIRGDFTSGDFTNYTYSSGEFDIKQSFLLNTKVSYNFWGGLTAFINLRNLFNINQEQFAWGDHNHILCFIGLQFEI